MDSMVITKARDNIYSIFKKIAEDHEPTIVIGKNEKIVWVSKDDWDSMEETLYILGNPELYKSIMDCDIEDESQWSDSLYD